MLGKIMTTEFCITIKGTHRNIKNVFPTRGFSMVM